MSRQSEQHRLVPCDGATLCSGTRRHVVTLWPCQSTCVCTGLEERASSPFQGLERRASSPFQVPSKPTHPSELLPQGCSCGGHAACTIPPLSTPQRSPPLPGDPGEEGDWMQAPCQDTGLQGGVWDGQAAPSQSCRHLPLLQKDAAFYHHPVRLTGTRINEFLISAPSFSSLPRGYTPIAPWQGGRGGYLQG